MANTKKAIVVDLECSCWAGFPPDGQVSEIIEIGFCEVETRTKKISEPKSIMVRPTFSTIDSFCTQLTGITPEKAKRGMSFRKACGKLITEFEVGRYPWVSWGSYDREMFVKCCRLYETKYPFSDEHFNLKTLFSMYIGVSKQVGLADAVRRIGAGFEGTPHRAADDAYNTAKILVKILKGGEDEAPKSSAHSSC